MKKCFTILLAIAIILPSCCVNDVCVRSTGTLSNFASNMFGDVIVDAVAELASYDDDDLFDSSFLLEYNGIEIKLLSAEDSTWTVKGATSELTFNTIVRMLPENELGFRCWSASGSGSYDEGNGYTAEGASIGDVVFKWNKTVQSIQVEYSLCFSGEFKVNTSYKSSALDELTLTWKDAEIGNYRYSFDSCCFFE